MLATFTMKLVSFLTSVLWFSNAYVVQRHGQDTLLRAEDGSIVYSTGIDDSSEGSDTDSDMSGDEDFFHGCVWTF